MAAHPVTIGEFYNFAVTARGYECPELWAPEDHALFAGRGQVTAADDVQLCKNFTGVMQMPQPHD